MAAKWFNSLDTNSRVDSWQAFIRFVQKRFCNISYLLRSLLHSEPCKSCFFCPHLSVQIPIISKWFSLIFDLNMQQTLFHKRNFWHSRNITCLTQRHAHYTEGLSCHRLSTFNLQQQYNAFKYFFKSHSNFHTFIPFLRDFWYFSVYYGCFNGAKNVKLTCCRKSGNL